MTREQWLKLDQARATITSGNYVAGSGMLEKVLCELPESPQAWALLAACYDGLGRGEQAEAACRRALGFAPEEGVLQRNLARILWNRGDEAAATALFPEVAGGPEPTGPADDEPTGETPEPEAEEGWSPFLDEECAGAPRRRLRLEAPLLPPAPADPTRRKKQRPVLPPFSASTAMRVGLAATRAQLGDMAALALTCAGMMIAVIGAAWMMHNGLAFFGLGATAAAPAGVAGILDLLLLAAISYIGVRLADSYLTEDNAPNFDDLWAVLAEWGLVGALAFTRTMAVGVACIPSALLASGGASLAGSDWGALAGLVALPLPVWVASRLWFAQNLAMAAEMEYPEALASSWAISRARTLSLMWLVVYTTMLALIGPAVAIGGIYWLGGDARCGAAFAVGLLLTALLMPLAAGTGGAAFRLIAEEEFGSAEEEEEGSVAEQGAGKEE